MAYSSMGAGGGAGLDDLSDPRTSLSSSQYVAPYPYDVDVDSCATPGASSWMSVPGRSGSNQNRSGLYVGVRQFLFRTLKQVHFTAGHESRPHLPLERPKRPDKNLQALCRLTQLTKEELKKFYRAFKQECPLGVAEPKHFRLILTKYFPLGDCSGYATCLFNAFDPQRKGYLTFEEMVLAISSLSRGSLSEKLRWVFTMYDSDGDGVIHKSEIRDVIVAAFRLGGHHLGGQGPMSRKSPSAGHHQPDLCGAGTSTSHHHSQQHQRPSSPSQQQSSSAMIDQLINQQTDKVFQKLDVNRDGAVTMDTFLQVCLQDQSIVTSIERLSSDLPQ